MLIVVKRFTKEKIQNQKSLQTKLKNKTDAS